MEEIIRKYGDMVFRVALIYSRNNREDAKDISQDVFLTLLNKNKEFNDSEHCKAWLIRTTINLSKKYYFRKKDILYDPQEMRNLIGDNEKITLDQDSSRLYQGICKLPERNKIVIILYYFEELSCREIAQVLVISEASVRKRLSRGRQYLRRFLEEDYE
jgi:RNA polymerase sigma-70 factor (ECF subfamily)